jgi:ATP-binding cassette subfamily F protein 3
VVPEYFAQDEATRLDPVLTVYETLSSGSPMHMVPAIRNILGGFLFSGDDVYKKAGVLSGGERTRLAVARMLLRPSNLLLLDEPTNHLDLDSKDVLLDALVDYGGTLIFVSHDRYFVERLATRIIEVGHGRAESFPGTYQEFLWRKEHGGQPSAFSLRPSGMSQKAEGHRKAEGRNPKAEGRSPRAEAPPKAEGRRPKADVPPKAEGRGRKADLAEQRKREKARKSRQARVADLETRIAAHETAIKAIEAEMAAPGFYEQRDVAQARLTRHQTLMWEVGELMQQWEILSETDESDAAGDA